MRFDRFKTYRVLCAILVVLLLAGCNESLHDMVARGEIENVKARVAAAPDEVAEENRLGQTPLFYAVNNSRPELVVLLIRNGADVHHADGTGLTPLHAAAMYGKVKEAKILIKAGADVSAKDFFGDTPMHTAAIHGQIRMVNLLLARGGSPKATNNEGLTPFGLAKRHGRTRITERLGVITGEE